MSTESAWHDFIANMHQLNQFMDIGWCVAFLYVRAVDVPFRNNYIQFEVQQWACSMFILCVAPSGSTEEYLFSIITMSVPVYTRILMKIRQTECWIGCSIDISRINWKREFKWTDGTGINPAAENSGEISDEVLMMHTN